MSQVEIKIDGVVYMVEEGKTILEACKENEIHVPTICHHDALPTHGSCRLCIVEVEFGGRTKLQTSCTYSVSPGLEVRTNTERVERSRKMTMELLLTRCPEEKMVQDLAKEMGVGEPRFPKRDDNCLLCGLCVRMCERMGAFAISFTGRGMDRELGTPFMEANAVCMTCGACYSICPTSRFNPTKVERASGNKPIPLTNEFDENLSERKVINIPFIGAVPRVVSIDREHCVHMATGNCGVCQEICERDAIDYEMKDKLLEIDAGNIIVATGLDVWDPTPLKEYGYGKYPNVVTALEFERLSNIDGPTCGIISRRSDGKTPNKIAWILGIGPKGHEKKGVDGSSISYIYAIKQAITAKEIVPQLRSFIFHKDLHTFGKGSYEYMIKGANDFNIEYIDTDVKIKEEPESHDLVLAYASEGKMVSQEVDMVVLATTLIPKKDSQQLADTLDIEIDDRGFFRSSEKAYSDLQSTKDGIYIIGFCNQPMNISESITTANGAAARIAERLTRKEG